MHRRPSAPAALAVLLFSLAAACAPAARPDAMSGAPARGETMKTAEAAPLSPCCPVVELRQYTLQPGARDTLIDLFEREFVETQEAEGMQLVGQFRDLDRPDRFVWLRGFVGMPERARALASFYGGPVWKAHRDAANATMIDSSDVLLLRPARAGSGLAPDGRSRPPPGAAAPAPAGLVVATLYFFDAPARAPFFDGDEGRAFVDFFEQTLAPRLAEAGGAPVATFVTESHENTFPRLPVREGENAFAWLARFDDEPAWERHRRALDASPSWRDAAAALARRLKRPPEVLRLAPTPRSRLRGVR